MGASTKEMTPYRRTHSLKSLFLEHSAGVNDYLRGDRTRCELLINLQRFVGVNFDLNGLCVHLEYLAGT